MQLQLGQRDGAALTGTQFRPGVCIFTRTCTYFLLSSGLVEADGDAKPSDLQPSVQIVGPTDVGKSSMAKLLLSYATRMQWQPTMVDLDIGEPCWPWLQAQADPLGLLFPCCASPLMTEWA